MTNLPIATIALILGTLVLLFVINKGVDLLLSRRLTDEDSLISTSIIKGGLILSAGMMLNQVFESIQAITLVLSSRYGPDDITWEQLYYFAIFTGIAFAITASAAFLSVGFYRIVSKGQSLITEVANDNIAVAILFSMIVLAMTLALLPAVHAIFDSMIPYPTIPSIR